jgi:carbon monoxide dehydrogenase subunit G
MKQVALFAFTVLIMSACRQVQGSGNIVTENRTTADFTGVSAGGAFEVEIKNGSSTEVRVEADDNVIKNIETTVSGHTLNIRTRDGVNFNNGHFKVYIIAPDITKINSSGAASIDIKNILKRNNKITLEASGAAGINGEVDAPEIAIEASGAANIKVSGRTRVYHAEASGSSTIKTSDLMSERTTVHASGAASAHVYASVQLDADADGAATIYYTGAAGVSQKTSGAANIKKDD